MLKFDTIAQKRDQLLEYKRQRERLAEADKNLKGHMATIIVKGQHNPLSHDAAVTALAIQMRVIDQAIDKLEQDFAGMNIEP